MCMLPPLNGVIWKHGISCAAMSPDDAQQTDTILDVTYYICLCLDVTELPVAQPG